MNRIKTLQISSQRLGGWVYLINNLDKVIVTGLYKGKHLCETVSRILLCETEYQTSLTTTTIHKNT